MAMTSTRWGAQQQEGTSRMDRKTIEKNRRLQMKGLCFKLAAILPKDRTILREALTQTDYLDQATCYIKHLQGRLETLKDHLPSSSSSYLGQTPAAKELQLPVLDVRDLGSFLETVLICSADPTATTPGFLFYDVVAAIEGEGVHVFTATYSIVNTNMFYTIHSEIPSPRVGTEAARVSERLKKLLSC